MRLYFKLLCWPPISSSPPTFPLSIIEMNKGDNFFPSHSLVFSSKAHAGFFELNKLRSSTAFYAWPKLNRLCIVLQVLQIHHILLVWMQPRSLSID